MIELPASAFHDVTWHDASLVDFRWRTLDDAGKTRVFDMTIEWVDWQTQRPFKSVVSFLECWRIELNMNGGLFGYETILHADEFDVSESHRFFSLITEFDRSVFDRMRLFVFDEMNFGSRIAIMCADVVIVTEADTRPDT